VPLSGEIFVKKGCVHVPTAPVMILPVSSDNGTKEKDRRLA
jgi:hypothetical protein